MVENNFWFVLYTKSKQEKKAKEQLDKISINNYLATIRVNRKWSDRTKQIDDILLKSYIFINCDEKKRLKALELPSIVRCLFDNGKPAVVPNWQIQNLRAFLKQAENVFISNEKLEGRKVLIKDGPFAGIVGTIQKHINKNYLSVSLDFINKNFTTLIPNEAIEFIETFSELVEQESFENNYLSKKLISVT